MADTAIITSDVVDGVTISSGVTSGATVTTSVVESTSVTANVVTGAVGPIGPTGDTGPANELTIGTVTGGLTADATITGTPPAQVLNLTLPKGDTGDQGPQGLKGDTGATGPTGADGPQGPQGIQGLQGDQGPQGIQGLKGDQGDPGPAGTDGNFAGRTITGTTNQIDVVNGDGVSGNPTLSLPSAITAPGAMTVTDQLTVSKATSPGLIVGNGSNGYIKVGDATLSKLAGSMWGISNVSVGAGSTSVVALGFGALNTGLFGSSTTVKASISGTERLSLDATTLSSTVHVAPSADSTYTNGTSSLYWSNTYTDRLYLNSTAYIDGGTAGELGVTGYVYSTHSSSVGFGHNRAAVTSQWGTASTGRFVILNGGGVMFSLNTTGVTIGSSADTNAPTHTLTLPSTSTGIALYNTADQTTNYERGRVYWNTNAYTISTEKGGTGTARSIAFSAGGTTVEMNPASSTSGILNIGTTVSVADGKISRVGGTLSATSGVQYPLAVQTTINQSSTAGYTALLINPTETATGSGAKNLIDAQVGGTSKFTVNSVGDINMTGNINMNTAGKVINTAGIQNNTLSTNSRVYTSTTGTTIDRNIGDANTALKVNQIHASSTGAIIDLQFGGVSKFSVSNTGTTSIGGGLSVAYVAKTADYTLTANDYTVDCTANSFTITLPAASGTTGRQYVIKNSGTGTITIDGNATETIDGQLTQTLSQFESLTIVSTNTGWIIV